MTDRACGQPDDALLADCDVATFRGGGPGGQKRNKTSNAVRLTHRPTGHTGEAGESRSLAENKAAALRRLRLRLAVEERRRAGESATLRRHVRHGRLGCPPGHDDYPLVLAELLDVLAAEGWVVGTAAGRVGISTSGLTGFLLADKLALTKVNAVRQAVGFRPLTA